MHCRWKWGNLCPPNPAPILKISSGEEREQWVGTERREFVDIRFSLTLGWKTRSTPVNYAQQLVIVLFHNSPFYITII